MVSMRSAGTHQSSWCQNATRGAIVAILASGSVVAGAASPAHAVGELLVSSDGVSWATTMPNELFTSTARLTPQSSETTTMYVRNVGTSAGYLRIALRDVVVNDASYGDALTVSASVPGYPGTPESISAATPCRVLTQGLVVAPGQTVPVLASIALGDLTGTAGQNEAAGFNLSITLSEGTTSGMQPTACLPNDTIVIVTPPPSGSGGGGNGGSGSGGAAAGAVVPASDGGADSSAVEPKDDVVIALPLLPPFTVSANTQDIFEQFLVFSPYAAMILGSGIFFLVARRRRRDDDELDEFGDNPPGGSATSPDLIDNNAR
jgi:hypothetical protein